MVSVTHAYKARILFTISGSLGFSYANRHYNFDNSLGIKWGKVNLSHYYTALAIF